MPTPLRVTTAQARRLQQNTTPTPRPRTPKRAVTRDDLEREIGRAYVAGQLVRCESLKRAIKQLEREQADVHQTQDVAK